MLIEPGHFTLEQLQAIHAGVQQLALPDSSREVIRASQRVVTALGNAADFSGPTLMVGAAADDPEFSDVLAELAKSVVEKLPRELRLDLTPERLAGLARDLLNGARP